MSALRLDGWRVRPGFVATQPTSPVSLIFDDAGVTQVAGDPPVAWQTPWTEVASVVSSGRRALAMTIGDTVYVWRRRRPLNLDEWRALDDVLRAHGSREVPRRRRRNAVGVVAVVLLATLSGLAASEWIAWRSPVAARALSQVNLSLRDVTSDWSTTTASTSLLAASGLLGTPNEVVTKFSISRPKAGTVGAVMASTFQSCFHVSESTDRVYGLAGQTPEYQVASPVLVTPGHGGIQVQSGAQYYSQSSDVDRDVAEMSRPHFGSCLAESWGDLLSVASSGRVSHVGVGHDVTLPVFAHGWVRAGEVSLSLPSDGLPRVTLVAVEIASGHDEVALAALVVNPTAARATLADLTNEVLVRASTTSATSA